MYLKCHAQTRLVNTRTSTKSENENENEVTRIHIYYKQDLLLRSLTSCNLFHTSLNIFVVLFQSDVYLSERVDRSLSYIPHRVAQASPPSEVHQQLFPPDNVMAPLLRRRLTCFYCGRRSTKRYTPGLQNFECETCEAVNHLDKVCLLCSRQLPAVG